MKTIIKELNDDFNKIQEELDKLSWDNYETDWLRWYLTKIYFWVCCYCESKFDFAATFNIEHFYPKSSVSYKWIPKYDSYIRTLENLHYSCPKCNNYKSYICPDWTDSYSLLKLNPSNLLKWVKIYSPNYILENWKFKMPHYKIEDKFSYDWAIINTIDDNELRWEWTINTFNLNNQNKDVKERLALLQNRQRYFMKATEISNLIKDNINSNNNDMLFFLIKELWDMMSNKSPYSSMIRYHFIDIYEYTFKTILNKKELGN